LFIWTGAQRSGETCGFRRKKGTAEAVPVVRSFF